MLPGKEENASPSEQKADNAPRKSLTSSHDDGKPSLQETTDHLLRLSQDSIDYINARDWEKLEKLGEKHVSPEFKSILDNYHITADFDEHVRTLRHMTVTAPDLHFTTLNATADINELQGYATVYQMLEVTGRPANIKRVSVCTLKFRKVRGKWLV